MSQPDGCSGSRDPHPAPIAQALTGGVCPPHPDRKKVVLSMLVGLGFLMVAVFMYLVLSKRATPVVGLILVPVAFG